MKSVITLSGSCKHGEFILTDGCPQCIEERQFERLDGGSGSSKAHQVAVTPEQEVQVGTQTALIQIEPKVDLLVIKIYEEGVSLLGYANTRLIKSNADLAPATDDLALIAKFKKAMVAKRDEYVKPIRQHLDGVSSSFKELMSPFEEADRINRAKVTDYDRELQRQAAEIARIESEKLRLAREEEALTGEHAVDLTPIEKPVIQNHTQTEMGTASWMTIWKFEVVDPKLVPPEYNMVDTVKVGQVVRATKGTLTIPGIRIYSEKTVKITG